MQPNPNWQRLIPRIRGKVAVGKALFKKVAAGEGKT
jgi:hypothetical protein